MPYQGTKDDAVTPHTSLALLTKPSREQMRADLARAMGWTYPEASPNFPNTRYWWSPDGKQSEGEPPDPFTSAADNRALVEWIAEDDKRWHEFTCQFFGQVSVTNNDYVLAAMTAPLETIAVAAWRAIQEK